MDKREIKAFLKRKDVKLLVAILIVGSVILVCIERNWFLLCIIIVMFFLYLSIKEEIKEWMR